MDLILIQRKRIITLIVIFVVCNFLFLNISAQNQQTEKELLKGLEPYFEALNLLHNEYIEKEIDLDELVKESIKGMLQSLNDPYTRYIDPQALRREQDNLLIGHFGGLGITITIRDEQLTIISVTEDTPADRIGLKAEDQIVEINEKSTEKIRKEEASYLLRGEIGTQVTLGIKREGVEETLKFTIIRDNIEVKTIKSTVIETLNNHAIDGKIDLGYIIITAFNVNTEQEFVEVLNHFAKDDRIQGIILDLRNNPGGLLESAVGIASKFIKTGTILYIKNREGIQFTIKSRGNQYPQWPLMVLVNEGSASASEIVAGAVQDNRRGELLGVKTFGKGLVQQIFHLSDGSGVVISTSEYYAPSKRSINKIGIEPDIWVEEVKDNAEDEQLNRAIEFMQENMESMKANLKLMDKDRELIMIDEEND